ncbi:LytR/AlgR family response regulator transcription factor [Pedobacter heparinus]|uniref:Response regulator receiver n=1 Tax=Pedobacter heparinus (strain ATCC 13125 / DSM 2366 / CIP 104194 / JCM 7457 / NBRC 12017 / NCIMB 9290 / NRRL B-14731 / HIM 762-3) TaxID=485917 RepID=C6XVI3_PEDHD|nr:LytTR family DNA-binding domain-containing protein [Pedobacter heparinus]ACU04049.1 response regulator receiver [Pedobacter heparinus DSM 2366]
MAIRTLIVDDEPHALEIIKKYAVNVPEIEIVDTCNNALKALQFVQHTKIDLVFLDIKMPGLTGTDLIRGLKTPPMIIFTTAYQEYAIDGFELNAIDYLLKPVPLERFLRAIDKVMQFINGDKNRRHLKEPEGLATAAPTHFLYLRIERQLVKVDTRDILWIESVKDYIKVVTTDKTFQTKQKISIAEKLLPIGEFMRIHRSFIIPVNKTDAYHPNYMIIAGNKIPIGRNYKLACSHKFNPGTDLL